MTPISNKDLYTPSASSGSSTSQVNSITYRFSELNLQEDIKLESNMINSLLKEGSDLNKWARVEDEVSQAVPVPPLTNPIIPTVGILKEKSHKKGVKQLGKQVTISPLIGLMNENTGFMNK